VRLSTLLAGWAPGSFPQPWTWADESADLYIPGEFLRDVMANGVREPVLLGIDGRVWDGHHRIVAAIRLGLRDVPVRHSQRHSEARAPQTPSMLEVRQPNTEDPETPSDQQLSLF
jgi:hypothetical protein